MPIFFPEGSNNFTLSLKLILISTSILSAAVALKLSFPAITDFAVSDVPSIYNGVVSWLRPPYLYLVINCIIITIVASSKLQSKLDEVAPTPPVQTTPVQAYNQSVPLVVPLEPVKQRDFDDIVMKDEVVEAVSVPEVFEYNNSINNLNQFEDKDSGNDKEFVNVNAVDASPEEVVRSSKSSPALISRTDSLESSFSNEKPPVSARFGHRRAVKASPEGTDLSLLLFLSITHTQ